MLPRRLLLMPLVPALLIMAGTLGYYFIEDWSLFDSLYMTIITLTTVGFGEVHPLSVAGRFFTMLLILGGVFTLLYAASEIIRAIVSGEVQLALGRQKMERSLAELKNHIIICGYGRMGRFVCKEFSNQKLPFVVIDRQAESFEGFGTLYGIALHGDATSDEILKRAGVERARALVTVAASDADNLYITMTARLLNDKLCIVARAESDLAEQKLLRAGANRVVSPYIIGGSQVAHAVLRPTVMEFIGLATRTEFLELQIEEIRIGHGSQLAGTSVADTRLRQDRGIIIVAIKKAAGQMVYNPAANAHMEPDDIVIALGHRDKLNEVATLAGA